MMGPTLIELKSENMSQEGMGFILNDLNYLYVGPMMEISTCVIRLPCNSWDRGSGVKINNQAHSEIEVSNHKSFSNFKLGRPLSLSFKLVLLSNKAI